MTLLKLLVIQRPGITPSTGGSSNLSGESNDSSSEGKFGHRLWIIAGVVVVVAIAGWYFFKPANIKIAVAVPAEISAAELISNSELETRYGFKIGQVTVIANGGMVDVRYQITQPQKALALLNDPNRAPKLFVTDSGQILNPTHLGMQNNKIARRSSIPLLMYPNVNTAIQPGTPVSVVFGDFRVEPIAAQNDK